MKAKREININESKHLERLALTTIAIVAVLGAVLIKAILLGEFTWHIGW